MINLIPLLCRIASEFSEFSISFSANSPPEFTSIYRSHYLSGAFIPHFLLCHITHLVIYFDLCLWLVMPLWLFTFVWSDDLEILNFELGFLFLISIMVFYEFLYLPFFCFWFCVILWKKRQTLIVIFISRISVFLALMYKNVGLFPVVIYLTLFVVFFKIVIGFFVFW